MGRSNSLRDVFNLFTEAVNAFREVVESEETFSSDDAKAVSANAAKAKAVTVTSSAAKAKAVTASAAKAKAVTVTSSAAKAKAVR